jgi:hypothetical protein
MAKRNASDTRTRQERGYDEAARGPEGVDQPPGPQDVMAHVPAPPATPDDQAAASAAAEVRRREHSADPADDEDRTP